MTDDQDLRTRIQAHVARYAQGDNRAAGWHLAATLALYIAGILLVAKSEHGLLRAVGAALLLGSFLKLFMVHHDLMHGCFFRDRRWNQPVALVVGALCHVAPSVWQREHDRHHKTSNNLDEPQDGQTAAWTLADYIAKPRWQRTAYAIATHPALLFTVGPVLYFFGFMRGRARLMENATQLALWSALYFAGLLQAHLVVFLPAAVFGFVVFHAQHTFDGAYRRRAAEWDAFENSMRGSSLLVLPRWPLVGPFLAFCAHGVEYHHAHHLHPGIPGYRLAQCHREAGELFVAVPRVSLGRAFATLHYALFDERTQHFGSVGAIARAHRVR